MPIPTIGNKPLETKPAPPPGILPSVANPGQTEQSSTVQTVTETQAPVKLSRQQAQNLAVLEAHDNVSLGAGGEPLSLLYRTALEALKEELEPILGVGAIEEGFESGLDVSPEATANRIVGLSTRLFSLFQEHNSDMTEEEQVERFVEVIGAGIEQGFSEAREILGGLNVLEGDIASNIDKTFELVQAGLDKFREGFDFAADEVNESDEEDV